MIYPDLMFHYKLLPGSNYFPLVIVLLLRQFYVIILYLLSAPFFDDKVGRKIFLVNDEYVSILVFDYFYKLLTIIRIN